MDRVPEHVRTFLGQGTAYVARLPDPRCSGRAVFVWLTDDALFTDSRVARVWVHEQHLSTPGYAPVAVVVSYAGPRPEVPQWLCQGEWPLESLNRRSADVELSKQLSKCVYALLVDDKETLGHRSPAF